MTDENLRFSNLESLGHKTPVSNLLPELKTALRKMKEQLDFDDENSPLLGIESGPQKIKIVSKNTRGRLFKFVTRCLSGTIDNISRKHGTEEAIKLVASVYGVALYLVLPKKPEGVGSRSRSGAKSKNDVNYKDPLASDFETLEKSIRRIRTKYHSIFRENDLMLAVGLHIDDAFNAIKLAKTEYATWETFPKPNKMNLKLLAKYLEESPSKIFSCLSKELKDLGFNAREDHGTLIRTFNRQAREIRRPTIGRKPHRTIR